MAETFRVSYEGPSNEVSRGARVFRFLVTDNRERRRYVSVVTPLPGPPEMGEIALERLELALKTVGSGLFSDEGDITEIELWGQAGQLLCSRSSRKECVWKERSQREWICLA